MSITIRLFKFYIINNKNNKIAGESTHAGSGNTRNTSLKDILALEISAGDIIKVEMWLARGNHPSRIEEFETLCLDSCLFKLEKRIV